jgi:hypothetical protein
MRNYQHIQERYLRDPLPVRLGGLAANLRRIKSFTQHAANRAAVESLLDESKHFIEWTARETEIDAAAQLVELQIQLSRWQRNLDRFWADPNWRQQVGTQSHSWADRVLSFSGLLR